MVRKQHLMCIHCPAAQCLKQGEVSNVFAPSVLALTAVMTLPVPDSPPFVDTRGMDGKQLADMLKIVATSQRLPSEKLFELNTASKAVVCPGAGYRALLALQVNDSLCCCESLVCTHPDILQVACLMNAGCSVGKAGQGHLPLAGMPNVTACVTLSSHHSRYMTVITVAI